MTVSSGYDDHAHAIPDLAREIPSLANGGISRDGKTITYHLMPNVKWHDGQSFTAADVVFTWHQIMNPNNNTVSRVGYDRITSIDTPDPLTLHVHLAIAVCAGDLPLSDRAPSVPSCQSTCSSNFTSLNRTPIDAVPMGTGAYIFKSWTRGSRDAPRCESQLLSRRNRRSRTSC